MPGSITDLPPKPCPLAHIRIMVSPMEIVNDLLIGTWGWSDNGCCTGYYPDDMPRDWQLCYYSNLHRTVILPEDVWHHADDSDLEQWLEDTDPGFVFVPAIGPAELDEISNGRLPDWSAIETLKDRIGCLLAMPSAAQLDTLQWLEPLKTNIPLAVWLPETIEADLRDKAVKRLCQAGASVLWDTRTASQPEICGDWLLAIAEAQEPAKLRSLIERLGQWMSPDKHAVLVFTGQQAPQTAEQARTLAELMGI